MSPAALSVTEASQWQAGGCSEDSCITPAALWQLVDVFRISQKHSSKLSSPFTQSKPPGLGACPSRPALLSSHITCPRGLTSSSPPSAMRTPCTSFFSWEQFLKCHQWSRWVTWSYWCINGVPQPNWKNGWALLTKPHTLPNLSFWFWLFFCSPYFELNMLEMCRPSLWLHSQKQPSIVLVLSPCS